jgi:hypothetical protein
MSRVVKIYVSEQDMWLIQALEKIVQTKQELGLKSSLSWELLRIAKNGLTSEMVGAKIDRAILTNGRPPP